MYKYIFVLIGFALIVSANAQDNVQLDLPGDDFSLEGAIEVFKVSSSPEDFEKRLNEEDRFVNNLDLNEDGETDYLRVIGHNDEDAHVFVIQAILSETEAQDVAVLGVEKTGNEKAVLQIIGDEELYGADYLVEPFDEELEIEGEGPNVRVKQINRIVVNVWGWPSVRYIYRPSYQVYVSPWRWRAYPRWWKPWRPHPFQYYHKQRVRYHRHCHTVRTYRVVRARKVYKPHRRTAKVVVNRKTRVGKGRTIRTTKATTKSGKTGKKTTVVRKNGKAKVKTTKVKKRNPKKGTTVKKKTKTVKRKNGKTKTTKTKVRRKKG